MKKLIIISILLFSSCEARGYDHLISLYARKHGLDVNLARALVEIESNYNSRAVSSVGALGLTQIRFKFHKERCGLKNKKQLFNPAINLNCGFKVLKYYIRECGSIERGLACYNAGKGGMKKGIGFKYARKVLRKKWKKENL